MIDKIAITKLVHFLQDGGTKADLAKDTGLAYRTVESWLNYWHNHEPKMVYVCGWEAARNGARTVKVYKWGSKKDTPPPKKSQADRSRDYRARKRLDRCRFHQPAGRLQ